jgi:hypothetical protein
MDRILDGGISGPLFLRRPEIAELVENALLDGERRFTSHRANRLLGSRGTPFRQDYPKNGS